MIDNRKVSTAADLARVWLHESRRVFADRLISYEDKEWFEDLARREAERHFKLDWEGTVGVPGSPGNFIMYADFLIGGADPKVRDEECHAPSVPQDDPTGGTYAGAARGSSKQLAIAMRSHGSGFDWICGVVWT